MSDKFDFSGIKKLTKELRKNPTESEKLFWKELRGRKLSGFKFLRQHPIIYKGNLTRYNFFIADSYCDQKKTIIEIDGPIHESTEEYDEFRDSELSEMGLRVIRIRNEELLEMHKVLRKIQDILFQIPDYK